MTPGIITTEFMVGGSEFFFFELQKEVVLRISLLMNFSRTKTILSFSRRKLCAKEL